MIVRII